MNIRRCTSEDANAVIALLPELWPHTPHNRQRLSTIFHEALRSSHQHYLCATTDSQLVGFCSVSLKHSLWCMARLTHIDELVVANEFRGHGIGRRLVERAEQIALANGCNRIELDSAYWREAAHSFYRHLGFENRAHLFSKQLVAS